MIKIFKATCSLAPHFYLHKFTAWTWLYPWILKCLRTLGNIIWPLDVTSLELHLAHTVSYWLHEKARFPSNTGVADVLWCPEIITAFVMRDLISHTSIWNCTRNTFHEFYPSRRTDVNVVGVWLCSNEQKLVPRPAVVWDLAVGYDELAFFFGSVMLGRIG